MKPPTSWFPRGSSWCAAIFVSHIHPRQLDPPRHPLCSDQRRDQQVRWDHCTALRAFQGKPSGSLRARFALLTTSFLLPLEHNLSFIGLRPLRPLRSNYATTRETILSSVIHSKIFANIWQENLEDGATFPRMENKTTRKQQVGVFFECFWNSYWLSF